MRMATPAKVWVYGVVLGIESLTVLSVRACQVLALCTLTIQNTALVLLTKYSYRDAGNRHAVSTVIHSAESVKIISS